MLGIVALAGDTQPENTPLQQLIDKSYGKIQRTNASKEFLDDLNPNKDNMHTLKDTTDDDIESNRQQAE